MNHLVFGSITDVTARHRGCHVLVGSHGGAYTASVAASIGVASLICHDAGVGLESAGIAGLQLLQSAAIPAAAVDYQSARIGDADDMLARGLISHVNEMGIDCGVLPGMATADAFAMFQAANLPLTADNRRDVERRREGRHAITIPLAPNGRYAALAVDSASLIRPADAGAIVVTGSHGGLPGGAAANAIKAPVRCAAFNDAGVGIDGAGIARLSVLEKQDIAGIAVSARSARIGEARSTYETGVISHANRPARGLGAEPGQPLRNFFRDLVNRSLCKESQ